MLPLHAILNPNEKPSVHSVKAILKILHSSDFDFIININVLYINLKEAVLFTMKYLIAKYCEA